MHPLHAQETDTQLSRLLDKTERYKNAQQAQSAEVAMDQLRPEITELLQNLITAVLVRHGNREDNSEIAKNFVEIFNRAEFKIIKETLCVQDKFWYILSSLLMTEAIEPSTSDEEYPTDESIQVEYDIQTVQKRIIKVIEIVKKELQNETR